MNVTDVPKIKSDHWRSPHAVTEDRNYDVTSGTGNILDAGGRRTR